MFSEHEVLFEKPKDIMMSKQQQKKLEALWKIENLRPQSMKSLAARLRKHYEGEMSIGINSPPGMYPDTGFNHSTEYIEYEGMLQFLANRLLVASFIHSCQMCLYDYKSQKGEITHVTYFNIQYITGKECESINTYLRSTIFTRTKNIFLLHSFIGWILDSISIRSKKNKNHYPLTNIWNDTTDVTEGEINLLVKNIMHRFSVKCLMMKPRIGISRLFCLNNFFVNYV